MRTHTHHTQSQALKLKVNTVGVVELLFIRRLLSVCASVCVCVCQRTGLVENNNHTVPSLLESEGSSTLVFY